MAGARHLSQAEPYVVDLATPLEVVLETTMGRRIGSAIVTHQDKLAGTFTQIDVYRSYLALLRECFPPPSDDGVV